ncbi:MAG: LrgB family protein [Oscillospiraceae bacterium]|nr:LrgB family protein [Oscillospiraceae bacterium]
MRDMLANSVFFGVILSSASYILGLQLKKKFKSAVFNPLLISIAVTIAVLLLMKIDYSSYYESAKYLSWFLTPATVCLAVPLYEQFEMLKKNWLAVVLGIGSGVLTSMGTILALALLCSFGHKEYVTFLPKSITTAIGMGASEELGGYVAITVTVIIITGVLGNIFGELVFKLLKIKEPVAKGIALGSSAHVLGTVKAMELGEVEGAMSSLSVVTAGILTVIAAPIFANII